MARKFLAFDLETATDVPGADFNWKPHRPLGISCAATYSTECSQPRLWYGGQAKLAPTSRMLRREVAELVRYLVSMVESGFTIVTWNGLGFDFDVLAEESGAVSECQRLALAHVDMMFHVFCVKGFPVALDSAARGCGIPGKSEGMTGIRAPQMWLRGQHQAVLDYAAQDVRATLELAAKCDQRRSLSWITRKGTPAACPLPTGWLTVVDASHLPEPDVSWMDRPMRRSEFMAWLKGYAS